jgi:hypothetical protein
MLYGMPSHRWAKPFMEKPAVVRGGLIRCQINHDDYACSYGAMAMSGDDGMDYITQVSIVRYVWAPIVMSCCARHSMPLYPEDLAPMALPSTERPLCVTTGGPSMFRVGSRA